MRSLVLVIGCLGLTLLYAGEQKFWDKQDPSTWSPEQVSEFTTASPWAKQVTAVLISNDSNMASSMPRGGGGRGRGGSGGRSAAETPASLPTFKAIVRWTSAKPMQQVLTTHLPETFHGHYVISVSGIPIGGDTAEMLEQTTLEVKRGDTVHPELAYQDPTDTSTIYFAFLPSMVALSKGKTAIFDLLAAPFEIKARFNTNEMKYRGNSEL